MKAFMVPIFKNVSSQLFHKGKKRDVRLFYTLRVLILFNASYMAFVREFSSHLSGQEGVLCDYEEHITNYNK